MRTTLQVVILSLYPLSCRAFVVQPRGVTQRRSVVLYDAENQETLTFGVKCSESSHELNGSKKDLIEFFQSDVCKKHFLSAGGTKACQEIPLNESVLQLWLDACEKQKYGSEAAPQGNDSVIKTENTIHFPGLRMENSVYSGIKTIQPTKLEFVLIAEEQKVFGALPIVWLYHKLTGGPPESGPVAPNARAFSVLELQDNRIVIHADLKITIQFPKVLLKILPTTKAKMEEQGSKSVAKAVLKDVVKCIDSVGEVYSRWREAKETVATK